MLQLGTCITPDFYPTTSESQQLNAPFYRSILYKLADLTALRTLDKPLLITLNNQCAEVKADWSGWQYCVQTIADYLGPQLLLLGCGNEFDLYWSRNHHDVPAQFAIELARQAYEILHPIGIKVAATSLASDKWPEYLRAMHELGDQYIDYYDIHPYGQRPDNWNVPGWGFGDMKALVQTATGITNKPLICSEVGVKMGDAQGISQVASYMKAAYNTLNTLGVPYAGWFAYTDEVGAPYERGLDAFGMRSENGLYRDAWYQYVDLNKQKDLEMPTKPTTDWRGLVGDGLLAMMVEDNTAPAMASEWRPFNRPPNVAATVEECIALNGWTYRWILPTSKGYRITSD